MNGQSGHIMPYVIPLLIIVLVVRRNLRPRQLRIERLWVLPVIIFALTAASLASKPPGGVIAMIVLPIALVLGCLAGWYRGRFTHIMIDPQTHALTSRASPLALALIAALFVIRYGLRYYLDQNAGPSQGALDASAAAVTDGLLLFSVGVMGIQRLEMWPRARKLLAEAQASRTGGA